MVNWWSIIKFSTDEAHTYLREAFRKFIRQNPDATNEEILEHLSDKDNIYDEYDMIREEDKRLGTMKDVEKFNNLYGRRQKPPAVLTDYQKNVVIPLMQKVRQERDPRKGALIGSALERELRKEPKINQNTLEDDLKNIFTFFSENDKYKNLRVDRTQYTEQGNLDIAATERARQEARAERNKNITTEEILERLKRNQKLEEERQKRVKRGGYFD